MNKKTYLAPQSELMTCHTEGMIAASDPTVTISNDENNKAAGSASLTDRKNQWGSALWKEK